MHRLGKDKNLLLAAVAALCIAAVIFIVVLHSRASGRLESLRGRMTEFSSMKEKYVSLRAEIGRLEARDSLTNVQGVVQAVEETFVSLGLKEKIKAVKSSALKQTNGSTEESAEVEVEKLSLNEAANVFYRIENSPMILLLRKVNIRKSFEDPSLLNLTMTVSFIKTGKKD